MASKVDTAPTKVVIVGAGAGARMVVKHLKGSAGFEITVIQPNKFSEFPFSGPLTLSHPENHSKFVTHTPIEGVSTIFGIAQSVTDGTLTVKPLDGAEPQTVPFDFLIAATGFSIPTLLAPPGCTLEDRKAELDSVYAACMSGGDVVVGGGGIIALEMAGNLAERVKATPGAGKVVLVASSVLNGYTARRQEEATRQLEKLGVVIKKGERVKSHSATTISPSEKFDVTLESGATLSGVSVYLPSFVAGANTSWLDTDASPTLPQGVLDPKSKQVVLDKHLRCEAYPKLFSLGGCAKLVTKESFLGVAKIEEQAKTIIFNMKAEKKSTPLKTHAEGMPDIKNGPIILVGHHTYAACVTEVMPAPVACCLTCCGFPINCLCPCFACAVCGGMGDVCACGLPCMSPEGKGTAQCMWNMALSGKPAESMGWVGVGKPAPGGAPPVPGVIER